MKHQFAIYLIATYIASAGASSAFSHIVLQDGAAAAGASYRATLRVGHGCDGAATTGISVTIPAGFTGAQPMPKPGWTVRTVSGKLAQPYTSHGKTFTDGVVEISWTANTSADALPSDFYDEFVLRGTTPTQPGPLWFKVVQTCVQSSLARAQGSLVCTQGALDCTRGILSWTEVPASGTSTKGLKSPAALLEVLDIQAAGGHNH